MKLINKMRISFLKKDKTDIKKMFISMLIVFFGQVCFSQQPSKSHFRKFRASVVKIDITPETSQNLVGYNARKSTGVYDRIYHRIVVLDDGVTQFFLISTEICILSPTFYEQIAAKINNKLGISPMNLWWTVTHTHSAPEVGPPGFYSVFMNERNQHEFDNEYTAFVEKKLIEGIVEARKKLSPARLGVGWGFSQANINRRAIDIDNTASLGLNPDGPTDRRIGLLRVDGEDGTPIACIANYPIHGTVLGSQNLEISGDAPGVVSEYFEHKTGVPLLFINGAAGNLAPIYSVYPNPRAGHLSQFQVLLGDKIIKAYQKNSATTNKVILNTGSMIVETPKKTELEFTSDLDNYMYITETGLELVKLPVRFLKINENIAIWSAPVELFCEISNDIRDHSPFPYTFYYGYTNGWFGYLVTDKAFKHQGYEPRVSLFPPGAASDLKDAVITYLQGIHPDINNK